MQQRLPAEHTVEILTALQPQPRSPAGRPRMVQAAAARVNGSVVPAEVATSASTSSDDAGSSAAQRSTGSFNSAVSVPAAQAAGRQATARPAAAAPSSGSYVSAAATAAAAGGNVASAAPPPPQQAVPVWMPQPSPTAAHISGSWSTVSSNSSSSSSASSSASIGLEPDITAEQIAQTYRNEPPADVHIVNTLEGARAAAAQLMALADAQQRSGQPLIFACDTEVMDIDVRWATGLLRWLPWQLTRLTVRLGSTAATLMCG